MEYRLRQISYLISMILKIVLVNWAILRYCNVRYSYHRCLWSRITMSEVSLLKRLIEIHVAIVGESSHFSK